MKTLEITAQSLDDVRRAVERIAGSIGADAGLLPTYGQSDQTGRPHIEFDGAAFAYVVCERGSEFERRETADVKELLFWVFESVTSQLAFDFELAHRIPDRDSRRVAFARQVELLALLDASWAAEASARHQRILAEHPFDDLADVRAARTQELRQAGRSADEAWRDACAEYPLP